MRAIKEEYGRFGANKEQENIICFGNKCKRISHHYLNTFALVAKEIIMITIKSPHFGQLQISGNQEIPAAEWLKKELESTDKAQEILACHKVQQIFQVNIHPTNTHVSDTDKIIHCLL